MNSISNILVVSYSQTGQLSRIVQSVIGPLMENKGIKVNWVKLEPVSHFPFPWPISDFFDVFPECVCMNPPPIKPTHIDVNVSYDLIIIAYQVWFLAPSLPITSFLQSKEASVMKGKPVITIIGCKDTWLMAQERVKQCLSVIGANLIDNVAVVDQSNRFQRLVATQRWLWTGKKNRFWKIFPPAGIDEIEINKSRRFGTAICEAITSNMICNNRSILSGLGAVSIDERNLRIEKFAYPQFLTWSKLIRRLSKPGQFRRKPLLALFFVWLSCLIVLGMPLGLLLYPLKRMIGKNDILNDIKYFEQPSGSSTNRMLG